MKIKTKVSGQTDPSDLILERNSTSLVGLMKQLDQCELQILALPK